MNKNFLSNNRAIKKSKFKSVFKKATKAKLWFAVFLLLIICSIAYYPEKYIQVAFQGILVWGTNVLPALFPFMIFTKLLTSTNYVEQASKIFSPITKKLFNCPGISSYVFLMSIVSGYPLGAKITADLYSNGTISRAEAHRITTFTSNSGPMFIVGTVGVGMLLSPISGYVILIAHILAAFLNGLIYRKYKTKEIEHSKTSLNVSKDGDLFSETMFSGISSVLLIGGYITIFFVITEALSALGFFLPLTNLLSMLGLDLNLSNGIIFGFFEMTKGCLLISSSAISLTLKTALCSLLISFGGLAISFQAFSFLNKFKISKKFYFLQKTTHALLTFLICLLLGFLFL